VLTAKKEPRFLGECFTLLPAKLASEVRPSLALGGIGVVAIGVAFPNLALLVVDEQFGSVFNRLLPPKGDGGGLGFKDLSDLAVAFGFDGPLVAVGYDVLILFGHRVVVPDVGDENGVNSLDIRVPRMRLKLCLIVFAIHDGINILLAI
jgi:hypothetical protein